jgi:Zn-dependent protease
MVFSGREIFDIVLMTLVIGFIFKDAFPRRPKVEVIPPEGYDPLKNMRRFKWDDFWFAVAVVAPSIILHEFGHKFSALSFGLSAEFHAAYTWLAVGLILKLISFGFMFFVPAYVSIAGMGTPLEYAIIAFAGPLINLVLWLGSAALLKSKRLKRKMHHDVYHVLFLTSKINMFLFIFNMLPIPGFDGWGFFSNLFELLF